MTHRIVISPDRRNIPQSFNHCNVLLTFASILVLRYVCLHSETGLVSLKLQSSGTLIVLVILFKIFSVVSHLIGIVIPFIKSPVHLLKALF